MPSRRRMLEYQKVLSMKRAASDPYMELANAIVELAAEDYRELMTKRIKRGLKMSNLELRILDSKILEIKLFFESDYGCLLAHGLNTVIWERLEGEFAEKNAQIDAALAAKRKAQKNEALGLVDEAFEALDCREIVAGIEETETQDLEVDACD